MPKKLPATRTRKSIPKQKKNRQPHLLIVGLLAVVGLTAWGGWNLVQSHIFSKQSVLADKVAMPSAVSPNFLTQVETCFIPTAKVYGYRLDITSDFRSAADQDAIYAVGRTEPGDIVTNAKGGRSWHNWGFAVDVADIDKGYDINWDRLTKMAAFCGLEHGDRGLEDLPHFQYRGGLSLEDMEQGKWPKPLRIPCQLMIDKKAAGKSLTKIDLHTCGAPTF